MDSFSHVFLIKFISSSSDGLPWAILKPRGWQGWLALFRDVMEKMAMACKAICGVHQVISYRAKGHKKS